MTAGSLWGGRVFPLPTAGRIPLLPATPLPLRHPASTRLCPSSQQTQGTVLFSIHLCPLCPPHLAFPDRPLELREHPFLGRAISDTPHSLHALPTCVTARTVSRDSSPVSPPGLGAPERTVTAVPPPSPPPTPLPPSVRDDLMNACCWDLCPHCCLRLLLRVNLAKRESLAFQVKGAPR